jgi:predicted alpha/beta hydrolase family esterase
MPEPYAPNLNKWAAKVKQVLKENNWTPDDSLSLIGHSTGVLAAMRYIEKLPVDVHIGPCVFVAGFPASLFHPDLPVLLARSPVVSQIKPKLKQLIAVHSTNDWRVPAQANGKWFEEKLDAQVIIFERAGHFTKRSGWRDWNDDLYREADRLFGFVSGQNH